MLLLLWALVVGIGLLVVIERDRLLSRIRAVELELAGVKAARNAAGNAADPHAVATKARAVEPQVRPVAPKPASPVVQPMPPLRPTPPSSPTQTSGAAPANAGSPSQPDRSAASAPSTPPPARRPAVASGDDLSSRLPSINVPAVAGIVISLIGFSFLLKLAIDFGWLALPIELRHLLVAACGAAFIAIGWYRREAHVAFSRTLLGGGWATISLTIYSAVLAFEILDPAVGFGLLSLSVAAAGALASRLRSRTLAVLALCGGIVAPLLLLEGGVPLPSVLAYYAVFSAAGLGLSLRHDWPLLHLMAFIGTFGSAALWIVGKTLLLSIGFGFASQFWISVLFALYLGIVLISVLRRDRAVVHGVERVLLFAVPSATLFLFAVGGLDGDALAIRSLMLAAVYAGVTFAIRSGIELKQGARGLAWGLAALAIPFGLEGRTLVVAMATFAAVQIFTALRAQRIRYVQTAVAMLVLTALYHGTGYFGSLGSGAFPDTRWLTGAWLAGCAFFAAACIDRKGTAGPLSGGLAFCVGVVVWLSAGTLEISRLFEGPRLLHTLLLFIGCSALVAHASVWLRARRWLLGYSPLLVGFAAWSLVTMPHPGAGVGWVAWIVALAALAWISREEASRSAAYPVFLLHALSLILGLTEIHHWLDLALEGAWPLALVCGLLVAWVVWGVARRGGRPVFRDGLLPVSVPALLALVGVLQLSPGSASPLPFLPVLNPVDLALGAAILAILQVGHLLGQGRLFGGWMRIVVWAGVTMTVLRTVHHYGGVKFDIASLFLSELAQTSLTIAWAVMGLCAMATAARRGGRTLWTGGAVLMALVVVKLFLIDLAGLDAPARIVSFLGVGALLLLIGYLAPVPPRETEDLPSTGGPGPVEPAGAGADAA
ncbi:hypothetical protein ABI59_00425 [Acidobacteria bacterium Mor1]|nr:hypothetical protein ABI59_00425 [Acidobacteria bacterium Mor1]